MRSISGFLQHRPLLIMYSTIEYRNATYHGLQRNSLRHGPGLLLNDELHLHLGFWHNDQLDGPFLYIKANNHYVFGQKRGGLFFGICVQVTPLKLRISKFKDYQEQGVGLQISRIAGDGLLFRRGVQTIVIQKFKAGTFSGLDMSQIVRQSNFLQHYPQLTQKDYVLSQFLESYFKDLRELLDCLGSVKFNRNHWYFGFVQNGMAHGLGLIVSREGWQRIVSVGYFKSNELEGFAKIYYQDQIIFQGNFVRNQINGKGLKYFPKNNSYRLAYFEEGAQKQLLEEGLNFPALFGKQLRKEQHLTSYFFENRFAAVRQQPKSKADINLMARVRQKPCQVQESTFIDGVLFKVLQSLRRQQDQEGVILPTKTSLNLSRKLI